LATLYALPALRKSPPPANSIRSSPTIPQPAPGKRHFRTTTPSNTALRLPRPLNQTIAPQPLPAFESRKRRRSRFNLSPKPAEPKTSRRIRRLYRQRHSRLLKKPKRTPGLEITKTAAANSTCPCTSIPITGCQNRYVPIEPERRPQVILDHALGIFLTCPLPWRKISVAPFCGMRSLPERSPSKEVELFSHAGSGLVTFLPRSHHMN